MDPGTAVGVASLGIQVCQGLLQYYRDWKDHDDDIRETYTGINDLQQTLELLKDKLQILSGTPFVIRARECLVTCQEGIQRLDKKLKKLSKETPIGILQKAQAGGLRLLYPFRKSTLEKLKEIVQNLMHHLSLAVQVILLDSSESTRESVAFIKNSINGISTLATRIGTLTLDTHTLVSATAAKVETLVSTDEAKSLTQILQWLSAPDRSIEHNVARKKHEEGTGEWLLKSEHYQKWLSGSSSILWLHGKAGCCKTVLCSTIVEDVRLRIAGQESAVLLFFYFTFSDTRKLNYENMLRSMVTELSRARPVTPSLRELYATSQPYAPSVEALEDTLIELLQVTNISYLIADALDECSEEQREQVIQGFKHITQACPGTRLLITSRREADIEILMESWCEHQFALDENCINADIDIFIKNALATDKKLIRLPAETKEEIERLFHEKSDGMLVLSY
jgi:hypothetical protein